MSGNAHIITGMDAIINPDNIKPGIDLKELERRMISGGLIQQKIRDPQDRFNDELKDAAKKLGISFGEFSKTDSSQRGSTSSSGGLTGGRQQSSTQLSALQSSSTQSSALQSSALQSSALQSSSTQLSALPSTQVSSTQSSALPYTQSSALQSKPFQSGASFSSGSGEFEPEQDSESESESESDSDSADEDENGGSGEPVGGIRSPSYTVSSSGYESSNRFAPSGDRFRFGADLRTRTQEQERKAHIDSVMGVNGDGSNFSFEREKREDMKCAMLSEIDSLMTSLADEDIDLSRIPKVDRTSSYEEVESVLKMLRHKNDHTRYCSFAEEFLLFGAYGLEELFDGKRMWFNRYQPDLTGWHNHVNVKLKRMRHDTGQLVSGVMQDYSIGPGLRVLLELIPNMFLYSKMRKQQHSQPSLFSDDEMASAQNRIRELTKGD